MTTATAPDFASAAPRTSLKQRLTGAVATMDGTLSVVSSVLLPLGLLMILLGWYGAARTPNLFEQVPYLISGGLLGIAFVVSGGLLYFSSWVAKSAQEQRAASSELLAVMREIRAELAARPEASVEVPAQTRTRRASANGSSSNGKSNGHAPDLVATATGRMLHRPDCAVVVNREDLHAVTPSTPGMQPCRLCDPLAAPLLR